jgi:hypothetical protein
MKWFTHFSWVHANPKENPDQATEWLIVCADHRRVAEEKVRRERWGASGSRMFYATEDNRGLPRCEVCREWAECETCGDRIAPEDDKHTNGDVSICERCHGEDYWRIPADTAEGVKHQDP